MSIEIDLLTILLLVYIVITVAAGSLVGRRVGNTICQRANIPEPSNKYRFIMISCIMLGGTTGPLLGIACLLSSAPG